MPPFGLARSLISRPLHFSTLVNEATLTDTRGGSSKSDEEGRFSLDNPKARNRHEAVPRLRPHAIAGPFSVPWVHGSAFGKPLNQSQITVSASVIEQTSSSSIPASECHFK